MRLTAKCTRPGESAPLSCDGSGTSFRFRWHLSASPASIPHPPHHLPSPRALPRRHPNRRPGGLLLENNPGPSEQFGYQQPKSPSQSSAITLLNTAGRGMRSASTNSQHHAKQVRKSGRGVNSPNVECLDLSPCSERTVPTDPTPAEAQCLFSIGTTETRRRRRRNSGRGGGGRGGGDGQLLRKGSDPVDGGGHDREEGQAARADEGR